MARIAVHRQEALPALDAEDNEFWAAVRALPKRQAQAIALYYLEDRPVAEVADILDCSPATAKVHLHKGRIRLAERLRMSPGDGS
jgi:RNA polymerase sigma-70 factor (ECF subfamily)